MKRLHPSVISPLTGENKRGGEGIKIALLLLAASALSAAPVLVEAYNEKMITIFDIGDTVTAVELSFSVDTACYIQLSTGGIGTQIEIWLDSDGERLPVRGMVDIAYRGKVPLTLIYNCLLSQGDHIVRLKAIRIERDYAACSNLYLQALIFLPDTATNAIAEQPLETSGLSPLPASIVSQGPYVSVAGATELVDASGRVIEDAIEDDKVYISNLSTGTYFARDGERTVVKIVKVE